MAELIKLVRPNWAQAVIEDELAELTEVNSPRTAPRKEDRSELVAHPFHGGLVTADELAAEKANVRQAASLVGFVRGERGRPSRLDDTLSPEAKARKQKQDEEKWIAGREAAAKNRTPMDVACISRNVEGIEMRRKPRLGGQPVEVLGCSWNAVRSVLALLFLVVSKDDERFWALRTSVPELSRQMGLSYRMTREYVERLLDEIAVTAFRIRKLGSIVWVPCTEISEMTDDGMVELKLNKLLQPYLLDLSSYFAINNRVLKLGSLRSARLYLRLRSFAHDGESRSKNIPMEELWRMMGAGKQPWHIFRKKLLQPALADIHEHFPEFKVRCEPKRSLGRKHGPVDIVKVTVSGPRPKRLLKLHSKNAHQGKSELISL